jgi:hypothetical protein
MKRAPWIFAIAAGVALTPSTAGAYRPFDGTDADVTGLGVFELELGPVGFDSVAGRNLLTAPSLVLNLGIFEQTELVADVDEWVAVGRLPPGTPRTVLFGADVLLKHVFVKGTLQDEPGPSVAVETGVLLPQVNGVNASYGGSLDVITSYSWPWATLHWNEWFQWTRLQHPDLFTGLILEGPRDWKVRPVAEVFFEEDFTAAFSVGSGLVGAIWTLSENWTLDAGFRAARLDSLGNEFEARLGFTWATAIGQPNADQALRSLGSERRGRF